MNSFPSIGFENTCHIDVYISLSLSFFLQLKKKRYRNQVFQTQSYTNTCKCFQRPDVGKPCTAKCYPGLPPIDCFVFFNFFLVCPLTEIFDSVPFVSSN